ncbi:ankyrin repeat-containing domain protein [Dendryphion nanum]|uniref:Ankyrin repeat-containing domain protein n=1 Tax=Dendryphion nanum TaxID=256645 RepID=A0A9P9DRZ5_9PLEO|nr:ankyrin repeat-containing domain protein [Dendryphion nanum]
MAEKRQISRFTHQPAARPAAPPGSKRKRPELSFTKCDQCRKDKQKCLPVERQWPHKCTRCIEKEFDCSESRKIDSKKKRKLCPEPQQFEQNEVDDFSNAAQKKLQDWLVLKTLRHMVAMAIDCLKKIIRHEYKLFQWHDDEEREEEEELYDREEIKSYCIFIGVLDDWLMTVAIEMSSLKIPNQSNIPDHMRLWTMFDNFWIEFDTLESHSYSTMRAECSICHSDLEAQVLQDINSTEHIGPRLLACASQWNYHCAHRSNWQERELEDDDSIKSQWGNFVQSCDDFKTKAIDLLNEHGLISEAPPFLKKNPIFLPRLTGLGKNKRQENDLIDCLGRTQLHQYLDHDGRGYARIKQLPISDIDARDIFSRTPLHIACGKSYDLIVYELLKNGADVNIITNDGSTPLHYAAANGLSPVCKRLIDSTEFDINALDSWNRSALYYAIEKRNIVAVEIMIKDPDIDLSVGRNPLALAMRSNDETCVRLLLSSPESREFFEKKSLEVARDIFYAARMHDGTGLNQTFISTCGDIIERLPIRCLNESIIYEEHTLLTWASLKGCLEVVMTLTKNRHVDINILDDGGQTALMCASKSGHLDIVEHFLELPNIEPHITDHEGMTALMCACSWNGTLEIFERLLQCSGQDLSIKDYGGETALMYACRWGKVEIVERIRHLSNYTLNDTNIKGNTSLMLAAADGQSEVVECLLQFPGVGLHRTDTAGKTASDLARENGHFKILDLLDEASRTLFHWIERLH